MRARVGGQLFYTAATGNDKRKIQMGANCSLVKDQRIESTVVVLGTDRKARKKKGPQNAC